MKNIKKIWLVLILAGIVLYPVYYTKEFDNNYLSTSHDRFGLYPKPIYIKNELGQTLTNVLIVLGITIGMADYYFSNKK